MGITLHFMCEMADMREATYLHVMIPNPDNILFLCVAIQTVGSSENVEWWDDHCSTPVFWIASSSYSHTGLFQTRVVQWNTKIAPFLLFASTVIYLTVMSVTQTI
jgi:hypothetical protein